MRRLPSQPAALLVVAVAFLLGSGPLVPGQETLPTAREIALATPATGKVVKVSVPENVLILRTADGRDVALSINEKTTFRLNDRDVKLSDVREGMNVNVAFELVGGRYVARSVASVATPVKPEALPARVEPAPAPVVADKPAAGTEVRGSVVRVLEPENTLLLRTADGKELRLIADERSQIRLGSADAKLVDLRPGTDVMVVYDVRGGKHLIARILGPRAAAVTTLTAVGHIRGRVFEAERPQPGLSVVLQTDLGKEVSVKRTLPDGTFAFEDVPVGAYRLMATKPTSAAPRVAEAPVKVDQGKTQEVILRLATLPPP